MFPGLEDGQWEPVYVGERVAPKPAQTNGHSSAESITQSVKPDVEMIESNGTEAPKAEGQEPSDIPTTTQDEATKPAEEQADVSIVQEEETIDYFDDPYIEATAVYPLKSGRIENWSCFFALLAHIYRMMNPNFQTPVMVVAQPCWTLRDKEIITQYFFETFSIPAITVLDSALAAAWGFGVQSACVVDVGLDKCDVTAITDYVVNDIGRGVAIEGCGGSALTSRLREELEKHKDKYKAIGKLEDIAEQLKKSHICEILPPSAALPGQTTTGPVQHSNPLVSASTGLTSKDNNAAQVVPAMPNLNDNTNEPEEDEGVLDVASIVAQSNAAEIIAKREREKAEKDAKKKAATAEVPKPVRLRNSEKFKASFHFEEIIPADTTSENGALSRKRKREVEVGPERFMSAAPSNDSLDGVLDRIAGAVHSTIMSVPDISARSSLWENLIIIGNGSRIRGFNNALIELLATRYTLSPSNATIFTSELPSNFSTPVPTGGTNTPIPGQGNHPGSHVSSGVNPLLVAATKNMMQPAAQQHHHLQVPGQPPSMSQHLHPGGSAFPGPGMEALQHHSYRGISQSPTSQPKTVKPPDYFPEWKDPSAAGMEEASFLGAQVAAKVAFIVDQGVSKGFLTRSEYNELGPEGIHGCAM